MPSLMAQLFDHPVLFLYKVIQYFLSLLLSPTPPPPGATLARPRIAVIGAGLTGVSAAAHIVGHGFDVVIFEAGPREELGGIWSVSPAGSPMYASTDVQRVNNTSGLQIHSLMYRFHPSVRWETGYPNRQQIVSQITELWKRYGLESRTKFNTRVTSVRKDEKGRWIVNDPSYGRFDGVMAAVGSCGDAAMPHLPGQDKFKGDVYHSSKLDGKDAKGKKVIVVGGGASAVEALEFCAHEGAGQTTILARSEKWIIPRNPLVDMLLALNIFGQETWLSWIPEGLLRRFFYRDLEDMAPSGKGIFSDTPMVNSDVMDKIRSGKAKWLRGDILGVEERGVRYNLRTKGVPKGGPGQEIVVEGDVIIMATGYQRPSLGFLPAEVFQEPYAPPNWYLQTFPPGHMSVCCNNCTFVNAIGTVGNYHVGIYTRLLLMFLVDPLTAPSPRLMRAWIEMTRFLKSRSPIGAFDFFTYGELIYWFVFCIAINPFRWKWAMFVFFGIGTGLPMGIVRGEDRIRNGLGYKRI